MKKIILLLAGILTLAACSSNESVEAQFEFGGAIHRVAQYNKGTPKSELMSFVANASNADKTTYFHFFPKEMDISVFKNETFNEPEFYQTIINSKPEYSLYKMPTEAKIHDDGIWLLEQAMKWQKPVLHN